MTNEIIQANFGKITTPVTKPQQDFNKLVEKIAHLRHEIELVKAFNLHLERRVGAEYDPLIRKSNEQSCALVHVFDRAYQSGNFKGRDLKKLEHLIVKIAFTLLENGDFNELKPIFEQYNGAPFDEINDEMDEEISMVMREMMEQMFNVRLDDEVDISDPEKFQAHLEEKIKEKEEAGFERKSTAKKSKKQQEKADKKLAEAEKVSKSVREVYLDLVKAFHPDREPDEAEKIRKTAIMQRVTAAYEKNDLLVLLELQLEFERIDAHSLNSIAEERLLHFNKVLSNQARELREELLEHNDHLAELGEVLLDDGGYFMGKIKRENIEPAFNAKMKELKTRFENLKKEVRLLSSSAELKAFLKYYQIPKASKRDGFFL